MEKILLTTERLNIRKLQAADLDDFHLYRSNPEVTKYQGFDVMNKEQAINFITDQKEKLLGEAGEWIYYGLEDFSTQQLIGDCAIMFHASDSRIVEIGITISHLHQKKGYGKEVLIGLLSFLFDTKQVLRIIEIVDTRNTGSIKLLESIGFRKEGHFIENVWFKGKWANEYQYALLKREWKKR